MVNTPYITEQVGILLKTESAYGTEATPSVGTDALFVDNFSYKPVHSGIQRQYRHNALNAITDVPGQTLVELSFDFDYMTTGVAATAVPAIGALEQAAGMFSSASASTVTYLLQHTASSGFPCPGKSATAKVYYRDQIYTVTGIYGNIVERHMSDGVVKCSFSGRGLYTAATTGAAIAPTMSGNYVKVASSSMTVHTYDPEWSEFEVDYGVQLANIPYSGNSNGISKIMITGRQPVLRVKTLMDSYSNHDFIGRYISKATGSLAYTTGTGTGNRVSYSFPTTQYREVNITDEDTVYKYDVTVNVAGDFTKTIA